MTQENRELLLKDLCNRIMHGVKCTVYEDANVYTLSGVLPDKIYNELYFEELNWKECDGFADIQYCKPYLFPLSSMTEEQLDYNPIGFSQMLTIKANRDWENITINSGAYYKLVDWLLKNHFDYRGLIPKGLAIDATGLNIY